MFADRVKSATPVSTKFKFAPAPCKPPKGYAIQRYDTVPDQFRVYKFFAPYFEEKTSAVRLTVDVWYIVLEHCEYG